MLAVKESTLGLGRKGPSEVPHNSRKTMDDARRWASKYRNRESMLRIAREEGVDPGTISTWLRRLGVEVRQGRHFVDQPPLTLPKELIAICSGGSEGIRKFLETQVWGIQFSRDGMEQADKFCRFLSMHGEGCGVLQIARELGVHRSTVLEWRSGTDLPYLLRMLGDVLGLSIEPSWMALPLRLESGGNVPKDWIVVPTQIRNYEDVTKVVSQLRPLEGTLGRAEKFGIASTKFKAMRMELFAYLLGIMLGDAGKLHSEQTRFLSMNLRSPMLIL